MAKRVRRGACLEPAKAPDASGGHTRPSGCAGGSETRAPAGSQLAPQLAPPPWPDLAGGVKPRPLRNMMNEAERGGGSCWINSALQALLANQPVRRALERLYQRRRESYATDLWRVEKAVSCTLLAADDPHLWTDAFGRVCERDASHRRTDERLAVTCRAMYDEPLTNIHIPLLMAQQFYRGRQEDAAEFLAQRLVDPDESPCMSQCLRGLDAPCWFALHVMHSLGQPPKTPLRLWRFPSCLQ